MDLLWRLRRYFRSRRPLRPRTRRGGRSGAAPVRARWRRPRPWQVTLLVGVLLAAAVIGFLEARLRPMVVTAAQAQALSLEFARRLLGERFEAVVATHTDHEHIHSHIVFNSVSFSDGRMFRSDFKAYYLSLIHI